MAVSLAADGHDVVAHARVGVCQIQPKVVHDNHDDEDDEENKPDADKGTAKLCWRVGQRHLLRSQNPMSSLSSLLRAPWHANAAQNLLLNLAAAAADSSAT